MADSARWNSFRDRFHADELVRTDELRSEVESVLREHGELSEPQLRERMRSFDATFGRDGRIYTGQRRQTELRNLWLWIDRFDDSGSRETLRAPSDSALGLAAPSTGEALTLSERLLHVVRPRIQNDVTLEMSDFRDYFSNGEFNLNDVPAAQREAMERVGLWNYFTGLDGDGDGRVRMSASQARMIFRSTEYRQDSDGSGNSAVLAFRPHDDFLVEDDSGARLTELGRGFLSMDAIFTPNEGVKRPGMLQSAGYVAASVQPDYAPSDVAEASAAELAAAAEKRVTPVDEAVDDAAAVPAAADDATVAVPPAEAAVEGAVDEAALAQHPELDASRTEDDAAVAAAQPEPEPADGAVEDGRVPPVAPELAGEPADGPQSTGIGLVSSTATPVTIAGGSVESAAIEFPEWLTAEIGDRTDVSRAELAELFAGRTWDPRSREDVGRSGMDPNDRERIESIAGYEGNRISMETLEGLTGSDAVFNTSADWRALFGQLERIDENGNGSTVRLREEDGSLSPVGQVLSVIGSYEGQTVTISEHRSANSLNAFNFDLLDEPWSDESDQTGRERLTELARTAFVSQRAQDEFIRRVQGLSGSQLGAAPAQLVYLLSDMLDNSGDANNIILGGGPNGEMQRTAAGQAYDILTSVGSRDAGFPPAELDDAFLTRNGVAPVRVPAWEDIPAHWQAMVGLSANGQESDEGAFAQRVLEHLQYDLSAVGGVDRHYGQGTHAATRDAMLLWNYYTGQTVEAEDTFTPEMVTALYGMVHGRVIDRLPERMREGTIRTDVYVRGEATTEVLREIDGLLNSNTRRPLAENERALARTPAALSFTAFSHFLSAYGENPRVPVGREGPNAFRTFAHQQRLYNDPRYAAYPPGHPRSNHQGGLAVDYHLARPSGWDDWGVIFGVERTYKHSPREQHHWEYTSNRLPEEVRRYFSMPTADAAPAQAEPAGAFSWLRDLLPN